MACSHEMLLLDLRIGEKYPITQTVQYLCQQNFLQFLTGPVTMASICIVDVHAVPGSLACGGLRQPALHQLLTQMKHDHANERSLFSDRQLVQASGKEP
jgi:hypothetical protein